MKEVDNCLRQIAKIHLVARGEDEAYVARSRLGRLVLGIARLVGKISGGPTPNRPCRLTTPKNAIKEIQTLVRLCNKLNDTAKTLVQPSEPLDERWRTGWSELLVDLNKIEQHLQAMENTPLTT